MLYPPLAGGSPCSSRCVRMSLQRVHSVHYVTLHGAKPTDGLVMATPTATRWGALQPLPAEKRQILQACRTVSDWQRLLFSSGQPVVLAPVNSITYGELPAGSCGSQCATGSRVRIG